jgi:NAD-dependent SIR2 family protein deacetylase
VHLVVRSINSSKLRWFDCAECHAELETHPLTKTIEMVFACKKCKKVFRKDVTDYDESDEYCPQYFIVFT